MKATEIIAKRRSIRKFTEQSLSEKEINTLIQAGMNAPSARNTQPWHFMVLKNKDTIKKIVEICPNGSMLKGADTALLVLGDMNDTDDYFIIDCAAAVQNILLAAADEEIGACWIGVYPRQPRIEGLKKLFNLPDKIFPHSLIALGKPAESKSPNSNFRKERVHYEKW
ncbi:MAG: nitroreductase family protein [Spirochaetales bacterium]|uniref:Nitroreductase family protein n=1 Tax=Candidatus Thalassospirochaeta sargassi TaxID=3119039 RepID=A0AAJ1IF08_9SPIO|nr:nitroreductase family protein [Spirochaetales bacterium]